MKTKKLIFGVLFAAVAVALISAACIIYFASSDSLCDTDVEALTSCEVTNPHGDVVFSCSGDKGECEKSLGGYTLTCPGKRN